MRQTTFFLLLTTSLACSSKPADPEPAKPSAPAPSKGAEVDAEVDAELTTMGGPMEEVPPVPKQMSVFICPQGTRVVAENTEEFDTQWREQWCEDKAGKRQGPYHKFRADGRLAQTRTYVNGVLHGPGSSYEEDGHLADEGRYEKGVRVGLWRAYMYGKPQFNGEFKDDVQHGFFEQFAGNGVRQALGRFEDGEPCGDYRCWDWKTGDPTKCIPLENKCDLTETGATCKACSPDLPPLPPLDSLPKKAPGSEGAEP